MAPRVNSAGARESRVRREGAVEQASKDREAVVERIVERLRCEPAGVLAAAEVEKLDELPEMEKAEHRLDGWCTSARPWVP